MNNKTFYVNASNCHKGGGKTLLESFIFGISNEHFQYIHSQYIIYVDRRFNIPVESYKNISFKPVCLFERFFISFKIKNRINENDVVINFGNLPPIIRFKKNKVILLLSSRFYIDNISFKGFLIRDRIKINLEKYYFLLTLKHVDKFLVQTNTMKELMLKMKICESKIHILPFFNDIDAQNILNPKEKNSFIYVASLIPYKNHMRLLEAWLRLKKSGITLKLYLTIDEDNYIKKLIKNFIINNNLDSVVLLENIDRNSLLNIYKICEYLIYPSYFEAYGLPLIEAQKYNLKILAADVDYCWDLINPYDYFNPYDTKSIERCVKRSIGFEIKTNDILSPKQFINQLIKL
jgi:glycosyltransferase involved in cell wall biosynthesis